MPTSFGTGSFGGVRSFGLGSNLDAFGTLNTVIVPSNIPQDGSVEVTQLIQDVIDSAPDNSRILFQPDAVYWCEHPLLLDGRLSIIMLGQGATLMNKTTYPYDKTIPNCTIIEDPAFPRAGHPKYTRFAILHSTNGKPLGYANVLGTGIPDNTVTSAVSGSPADYSAKITAPPGPTGVENPIPLVPDPGITITFRPRNATLTRDNINMINCRKCKILGFTLIGSNASAETAYAGYKADVEAQHGVTCIDSDDIEIAYNNINHVWGDFVNVQSSTNRGSNRVYIHDNDMHHDGRQGITPAETQDCVIVRNKLAYCRRSGIDIEVHDGGIARRITIADNDFGPIWPGFNWVSMAPYGTGLMTIEDIVMHGNRLHCAGHINVNGLIGGTDAAHPVGNRDVIKWWGPLTVTNNICDENAPVTGNSTKYAFDVEAFHDVTIVGNFFRLQAGVGMRFCRISECVNVEVHDNDFRDGIGEVTIIPYGGTLGGASFAGGGDLAGAGIQSTGGTLGSILMSGGGTLASVGKATAYGVVDFLGGGSILGTGKETWHGSASFSGGGTLAGDGIVAGIGTLQGGGTLSGSGKEHAFATFGGGGTLSGAGGIPGAAAFTGGGTLSGDGIVAGIGALQGGGYLVSTGRERANSAFNGGGKLVAHGEETEVASFNGGGLLVAVGVESKEEVVSLKIDNGAWRTGAVALRGPGWNEGGWQEEPWGGLG